MLYEVIWDGVFGGRMDEKQHVINCFERHNQEASIACRGANY